MTLPNYLLESIDLIIYTREKKDIHSDQESTFGLSPDLRRAIFGKDMSNSEILESILGMKFECDITTDKNNKSQLYINIDGAEFKFGPEALKYAFQLYPNLCKYFDRRKQKRELEKFIEQAA